MTSSPTVAVLNRVDYGKPYRLGAELEQRGLHVIDLGLDSIEVNKDGHAVLSKPDLAVGTVPHFDVLLWRLSEDLLPATDQIRFVRDGRDIPQVNTMAALNLCGDKRRTARHLAAVGIPVVPAYPALPGAKIPPGSLAKPAHGAGPRGVIFGSSGPSAQVSTSTLEPWVIQPDLGGEVIRVLVVGGEVICAYERIPEPGNPVSSIDVGGKQLLVTASNEVAALALTAAENLGATIAGVDIVLGDRLAVLEVNGTPDIPSHALEDVADLLALALRRAVADS